jgi:hypothetical protein
VFVSSPKLYQGKLQTQTTKNSLSLAPGSRFVRQITAPASSKAKPDNHLTCPDRTFFPRLVLQYAPAILHAATTQPCLDLPRVARASSSLRPPK